MSLKQTNCTSCRIFDPCYQVCCVGIYLCRDCLLDNTILNECYVCPVCNRQLAGAYRPLIMMAQYNQLPYDCIRNNPQQFGYNSNPPLYSNNFSRGNSQFHYVPQEEDFNFVQNLPYENTSVKRSRDNLHFDAPVINNNFNQSRQNFNSNQKQNNLHNDSINPFLTKFQPTHNRNRSFNQFSNPNNLPSNPFTQKANIRNSSFNANIHGFNPQNQKNLGFYHQNSPYMNHQFSHNQDHSPQRVLQNGFTQNFRRNPGEINVFKQNCVKDISSENNRYFTPTFGFESNELTLHGKAEKSDQRGNQKIQFRSALKEEKKEMVKAKRLSSQQTFGARR